MTRDDSRAGVLSMNNLKHRQCFHQIMAGKPAPWIPNYELGCWGQTVQRWLAEGAPADLIHWNFWQGVPFIKIDRHDYAYLNAGMMPEFEYQVLEEDADYLTARHSNGIVTKALKAGTVGGTRMSMDQYLRHPVTDRASWLDVKRRYDPTVAVRYPMLWDEMAQNWQNRDYPVCLIGNGVYGLYSQLRSWVGTEEISYMFYDDPALVEEMVEFHTEFLLQLVPRALQTVQFDYFNFFEDCAGKGGPLYGPEQFDRFFRKPYTRIIHALRQGGVKSIWLDCDGDPLPLVSLWMDVGVNCLWPLEQASGMDPRMLRKRFGPELILAGGIDKMEIAKGRKAIDAELEAKIPPLLQQGGYIPFLDHAIPPDISYADFMYYLERKLELMGR